MEGYFSDSASAGGGFTVGADQKLLDTMTTAPLAAGEKRDFAVGGTFGMPTYGVAGAMVSIEAHDYTQTGSLEVYPSGWQSPGIASLSFESGSNGESNSTTAVIRPGSFGKVTVYNRSAGVVQVKVNWQGWGSAPPVIVAADQPAFVASAQAMGAAEDEAKQAIYIASAVDTMPTATTITTSNTAGFTTDFGSYSGTDPDAPAGTSTAAPTRMH